MEDFLYLIAPIVIVLTINTIIRLNRSLPKDPVKHCKVYKQFGCSHVDGMLCNYNTCDMRVKQDLWELEEQLDIPLKDRHGFNHLNK